MSEFEQDTEITPVIFRRFGARKGGEVIALFCLRRFAQPPADMVREACRMARAELADRPQLRIA